MSKAIDLTGKKFEKLTVIKRAGTKRKECLWECLCECEKVVTVTGYNLRSGHTKSCGCLVKVNAKLANTKHGLYGTRIHRIYYNMKNRCYNPKYYLFKHYGGKGLTVCEEWLGENGLMNFYNWSMSHGYEDNLSIDRIDNNKGYSPDNCRWVTMKDQQNNRTNNKIITFKGQSHTMREWSEVTGISYSAIQARIKRGLPMELVLSK